MLGITRGTSHGLLTMSQVCSAPHSMQDVENINFKSILGSSLMLTMVDSNSSTGGILESYYNITCTSLSGLAFGSRAHHSNLLSLAGATETCHSTPNQANLATIVPNVTNSLETCQLWGLKITGGQKPYTVVISSLGATLTTNVTMGINDDVLTWPNRASPNGEVMGTWVLFSHFLALRYHVHHTASVVDQYVGLC